MDDTFKPSKALPIAVSGAIAVSVFGILLVANGGGGKGGKTPSMASVAADKPADTPADKPAEVAAADKPADHPADRAPADKPADKPAEPPAPKTVVLTI